MDHVVIRKLEHLTGDAARPELGFAIETRDRPGPAHKNGAFPDDRVWIQLHGGLMIAKARVKICWVGEYSSVNEIRARTRGSKLGAVDDFWKLRPRFGYAAVAELEHEAWIDPVWAGPRSYSYEWVVLDNDSKKKSWTEPKDAPRRGEELTARFSEWNNGR